MKYSVIIPVYNAEKTLRRCLDSLASQDYPDAEFLLIDDGSKDSSPAICLEYEAADDRFRILPKENGGVSTARNMGLDAAKGEFVLFVDSDDYVAPDYFSQLDQIDPDGSWDCLLFSYSRFIGPDHSDVILPVFCSADPAQFGPRMGWAVYTKHLNAPWNKRYRRSILEEHHLRFHTALPIAEDMLFNMKYMLCCRSLCTSSAQIYSVSLENPGSLSRKPLAERAALLALAGREADEAIRTAAIDEGVRDHLLRARNFLRLSDIYSEGKQLHLAGISLPQRWKTLHRLCTDFHRRRLPLPGARYCRLLALPVRMYAVPVIDLLSRRLAKK